MIGVGISDDAAHVEVGESGLERLEGDGRQGLRIVGEMLQVQLLQLLGVHRRDTDRHVLQVLGALLRRHHDLRQRRRVLLSAGGVHRRHDGSGDRRMAQ